MTEVTLCEWFQRSAREGKQDIALRTVDDSTTVSWARYSERVRRISGALASLGISRGDAIGLMLTNRPEFNIVDAGAMHLGAMTFSVYSTSPVDQIRFVLTDSDCRVVVCEAQFLDRVREAAFGTKVEHLICVDRPEGDSCMGLAELESLTPPTGFNFEATWRSVQPDDVLTLIYTSGTTGNPKGVELTHANVAWAIRTTLELVGKDPAGLGVVSYLPDAHLVNRYVAHYGPMMMRMSVTTVADPKTLLDALTSVRPALFVAVPMLWYKLKARLEGTLEESSGLKSLLPRWAIAVGQKNVRIKMAGGTPSLADRISREIADRLVLRHLRRRLGLDLVEFAVSGAAPIAEEAMIFISALGLEVCEAWGMTETTALTTLNRPGSVRIGTVGTAAPDTEVRLADDGELLVRGPGVMRGYHNDPARTAEVLDPDGWFHTGDVGTIDPDGFVTIVDRKKEIIINSGGKNMSPASIENTLKVACPLVGASIAIGDSRPHVAALITLDRDEVATFAASQDIAHTAAEDLCNDPLVLAAIAQGVEAANARLSRVEHIRTWKVLPVFWDPGSDELTPTLKLRRKQIYEKYADAIDGLYPS